MIKRLFASAAIAAALLTASCSTGDTPAMQVAKIEIAYTGLAKGATIYLKSGQADPATAKTVQELNDAIDHKGDDGQQHGLLVAARTAAENGDSVTVAASIEALNQGVAALASYEAQKGIAHQ